MQHANDRRGKSQQSKAIDANSRIEIKTVVSSGNSPDEARSRESLRGKDKGFEPFCRAFHQTNSA